jgi:hypothetical protein
LLSTDCALAGAANALRHATINSILRIVTIESRPTGSNRAVYASNRSQEQAAHDGRNTGEVSLSVVASHTDPVQTPAAPIAMQPAICLPVMMPPAARTGTLPATARRTSGIRTIVETPGQLDFDLLRRIAGGAKDTETSGPADPRHHIAAVAEGEQGEFDPQHGAEFGVHWVPILSHFASRAD